MDGTLTKHGIAGERQGARLRAPWHRWMVAFSDCAGVGRLVPIRVSSVAKNGYGLTFLRLVLVPYDLQFELSQWSAHLIGAHDSELVFPRRERHT